LSIQLVPATGSIAATRCESSALKRKGHRCPIRKPSSEDAIGIDRVVLVDPLDHRIDEGDIIDLLGSGMKAA
jgi:hypothetical protein